MATPYVPEGEAADRPAAMPVAARVSVVIAVGLLVGAATSILQKYLDSPWDSLANAISPWLTPTFVLGGLWRRARGAALAGIALGVLELTGYYVTAAIRGYPAGTSILAFWAAGAVVGGPVFGAAGWSWWRGPSRWLGLGAAILPAAFLSEAVVSYGWRLHYNSRAVLFAIIGAVVFALAGLHRRQHARAAWWLPAAFAVGAGAQLLLGLIYSNSF
jgi:hypothetical protein